MKRDIEFLDAAVKAQAARIRQLERENRELKAVIEDIEEPREIPSRQKMEEMAAELKKRLTELEEMINEATK